MLFLPRRNLIISRQDDRTSGFPISTTSAHSMEQPLLDLQHVTKRYGTQVVVDDVSFSLRRGEFFSLLGSSGCGKSTTLRMIAGFETPDSGSVRFAGDDGRAPAYVRHVNMVFQSYALFPHMTVEENVSFGLRMSRTPPPETKKRVAEMLALVQLQEFAARLPRQLSGGQQQRVALARALATRPNVVLLDEPLGALDLKLRKEMQQELKRIQESLELTFVYVTHDQEEALAMSDRICVMNKGRAEQIGTPEEIYERPRTKFVADFIGESNFLSGHVAARSNGWLTVDVDGLPIQAAAPPENVQQGDSVLLAIRPERIQFEANAPPPLASFGSLPQTPGQNQVRGQIQRSIFCGSDRVFHVQLQGGITLQVREQTDAAPASAQRGADVVLSWPADAVSVIAG
jgi:spermidine/putrescine transport system ATP-binding protein